jgi:hypothetical protein
MSNVANCDQSAISPFVGGMEQVANGGTQTEGDEGESSVMARETA